MALPLFLLIGVSASLIAVLTCAAIVLASWRVVWILWCHNVSVKARRAWRGLDKRALRSLPRAEYDAKVNTKLSDCAICLMEFVSRDVIRVLPHCGHGFHANCIDRWLNCRSSCPSCRGVLSIAKFQNGAGF